MNSFDISKWILEKNPILYYGSYDGNVKLNKLLYFSNLMYYSLYNKNLIDDIYFEKWENRPVIRKVYNDYRYNNCKNISNRDLLKFDDNIEKILNIVNLVYFNKTAKELSDETHTHSIWLNAKTNGKIDFSKIDNSELNMMNRLYNLYKNIDFDKLKFEIINGTTFYYFVDNINMDDNMIKRLEEYEPNEKILFVELLDGELVFS